MRNNDLSRKRRYDGVSPLGENDYLLRVDGETGFFAKLTQKGEIPKSFIKWRNRGNHFNNWTPSPVETLDIMIHRESFAKGWKFVGFRGGESQDWARLKHPLGFEVEVHIRSFIKQMQSHTIINGELQGRFKWSYSKLISEKEEAGVK